MAEEPQYLDDLLKLPIAERLRLARRLIDSAIQQALSDQSAKAPTDDQATSANGLLALAGRFAGGPGNSAERAEEILESEVDADRGLGTQ